ncbi:MAG TPA: sensor histidine kinase, partial [Chroococcales cyanobacterium]
VLQVVVNYLGNAIKFAPPDSKIEVSAQQIDSQVRVSVQDEGPGMTKDDQKKLFQKFYQTEDGKAEKGFGLGLAICKLIVESHGGKVGVESEPGKGACFWFKIDSSVVAQMTEGEAIPKIRS